MTEGEVLAFVAELAVRLGVRAADALAAAYDLRPELRAIAPRADDEEAIASEAARLLEVRARCEP